MADGDANQDRLEQVVTRLLKLRLGESLTRVEAALGRWRAGELGLFEAHAEVLRHGARSEKMVDRMADLGQDATAALVREAFERELIDRAEVVRLTGKTPEDLPAAAPEKDEPSLPSKRHVVDRLLGDGPVLVHIDARRPEVSVPDRFRRDPRLVLRFGHGLTPAIVDLSVDESGVAGTLSFGGVPHRCMLPWTAIYAVVGEADAKGMVWPEDVPPDVHTDASGATSTSASTAGAHPGTNGGGTNGGGINGGGINGGAHAGGTNGALARTADRGTLKPDSAAAAAAKKRGGHLRLVD